MNRLTSEQFRELASVHGVACLSFFIPTHPFGQETLNGADALQFRNFLREAWHRLADLPLAHDEIDKILAPGYDLLSDPEFWRHRSEGLALFLREGKLEHFDTDRPAAPYWHLGHRFYLLPLINGLASRHDFYLLLLQWQQVRLFRGYRGGYRELALPDGVPDRLEAWVGQDHEMKSIQVRNLSRSHRLSVVHGQGEGRDDRQHEEFEFLRALSRGLSPLWYEEGLPLFIASAPYIFSMYREVNNYTALAENLPGGRYNWDPAELCAEAWRLNQRPVRARREERAALYRQLAGTRRAGNEIDQILPAALAGQVDTLFIPEGEETYGFYDARNGKLVTSEPNDPGNAALYNLVAIETFLRGGQVYVVDRQEMPDTCSSINAIYRYA